MLQRGHGGSLHSSFLERLGLRFDPFHRLLKVGDKGFEIGLRTVPGFTTGLLQVLQFALD